LSHFDYFILIFFNHRSYVARVQYFLQNFQKKMHISRNFSKTDLTQLKRFKISIKSQLLSTITKNALKKST